MAASSAKARENSRSPVAIASARPPRAQTVGTPRRSERGVEHVVVDERRRVHELDGRRARDELARILRLAAGREQHEQRAQPLAARGDRRAGVLGEERAVAGGERRQALLDAREQQRHMRAGGLDDDVDALRVGRHGRRVPTCSAMMPPAVST